MTEERKPQEPEEQVEDQVEDLDVPEEESEDVKGGIYSSTSTSLSDKI